jgi:hypothetical protein
MFVDLFPNLGATLCFCALTFLNSFVELMKLQDSDCLKPRTCHLLDHIGNMAHVSFLWTFPRIFNENYII